MLQSESSISTLPQRKNIRATFHDYSGGDYFITICTKEKEHFFGNIINGKMIFSEIGEYADEAIRTLNTHYSYIEVPLFVVMPNHVHAIIRIREKADAPGCIPTIRTALGVVIGGYKQSVTRYARRNNISFEWQSRFHDHIIRGPKDGRLISEYIINNVTNWDSDCFNNGITAQSNSL
ncbi:MAG: transposase [Muribaculaceae bacterium]|nr:transposase [Muribaculaceae bacterium]